MQYIFIRLKMESCQTLLLVNTSEDYEISQLDFFFSSINFAGKDNSKAIEDK